MRSIIYICGVTLEEFFKINVLKKIIHEHCIYSISTPLSLSSNSLHAPLIPSQVRDLLFKISIVTHWVVCVCVHAYARACMFVCICVRMHMCLGLASWDRRTCSQRKLIIPLLVAIGCL